MKIVVDKKNYKQVKNDNNEYIYVFENETLQQLLNTKLHCIHYSQLLSCDINTTEYNIKCKRKMKITDDFTIKKRDYKISIIIPNRDYGEFLSKCFDSILNQTYKNYEVIFVDDMSTDNSIKIANIYKKKFNQINVEMKIIQLRQRRYNGGARNTGYLYLDEKSDYIYYIDADDWLYDNDALKNINEALTGEPDVLFVGLAKCKFNTITKENIPQYKDKYEAMQGWSGSCGKVIKKELATSQECLYNEGTLKEDKNQHCRICIYMNDFKCLDELIYVWNQENTKSITTIRENIVWGTSTIRHYADTLQLALSVKGRDEIIDTILQERLKKCEQEIKNGGDRQF